MPVYEYRCGFGHVMDHYATVVDRHKPQRCKCGAWGHKVILTAPRVFGDFEGYESPASGRWIEGRRQRLEDLARTGCRPYEAGEKEEMVKRQARNDAAMDAAADEAVERTLNEMTL